MAFPHTAFIPHTAIYPGEVSGVLPSHSLSVSGSEGLVEREERRRGREEHVRGRHDQVGAGVAGAEDKGHGHWAEAGAGAGAWEGAGGQEWALAWASLNPLLPQASCSVGTQRAGPCSCGTYKYKSSQVNTNTNRILLSLMSRPGKYIFLSSVCPKFTFMQSYIVSKSTSLFTYMSLSKHENMHFPYF